jgi:hypothetical protein
MSGIAHLGTWSYADVRDEFADYPRPEICDELRSLLRLLGAPEWVALVDLLEDREKDETA